MRSLKTSTRLAGLIAVVVLATGITTAAAQTENRRGHGERAGLELTYTKWFAPGFPHMVGVVGGGIVGQFGGAVLNNPMPDAAGRTQLTAIYIVRATDAVALAHHPCRGLFAVGHGRAERPRRRRVAEGRACTCRVQGDRLRAV